MSLDCAARKGQDLGTSQLEIVWNDEVLQTVAPEDYKIQKINLKVRGNDGENTLVLRGVGKSDKLGISVDNVKLVGSKDLPSLTQEIKPSVGANIL